MLALLRNTFEDLPGSRRYTIPELAKTHRVFAVDLLGFGWSDKPLVEYSKYEVWPEQLAAFVKEVGGAFSCCQPRLSSEASYTYELAAFRTSVLAALIGDVSTGPGSDCTRRRPSLGSLASSVSSHARTSAACR